MRRFLLGILCLLTVALVIVPTVMGRMAAKSSPAAPPVVNTSDSLEVKVYFPDTKQIRVLDLGEYLKGVVAAEMPPDFELEALKAQFVVARTFAVRRMPRFSAAGKGGCSLNLAADVCADPATGQAYISREEAAKKLGYFTATSLWKRLDAAEAATAGQVLAYRGELIDPLYHSVSGDQTEDVADYFGQSLPYLKSVDDHWGASAPKLVQTVKFTPEKVVQALSVGGKAVPALATQGAKSPVQVITRTASGRVKTVRVAGVNFTGREFRERLGLRSTDFTVAVKDGQLYVTTHGYGHGVGMSQYGANGMASEGHSYKEILDHYYTGVRLTQIFGD